MDKYKHDERKAGTKCGYFLMPFPQNLSDAVLHDAPQAHLLVWLERDHFARFELQ